MIVKKKNCESTDVIMFQFDIREMTPKKTLLHHFSCRAVIYIDLKVLFYPVYTGTLVCKICFFIHRVLAGSVDLKNVTNVLN